MGRDPGCSGFSDEVPATYPTRLQKQGQKVEAEIWAAVAGYFRRGDSRAEGEESSRGGHGGMGGGGAGRVVQVGGNGGRWVAKRRGRGQRVSRDREREGDGERQRRGRHRERKG